MKYEVYTSRFDVEEELYTTFNADSDEEAIRYFYELKGDKNLDWENLHMIQVQIERKTRPVASLNRMGDNKNKVIIHKER